MKSRRLSLPDVVEIVADRHGDHRGYFSETFRHDWFSREIADVTFVQENQSLSRAAGVVRGLHFQTQPHAQGKLVRCVAGAIFDVAVDIRIGSPDFGHWTGLELSAEAGNQLWVPPGFLHGFCTLGPETLVCYKVTAYFDAPSDAGVAWDDPDIAIAWPDLADPAQLSARDKSHPRLRDLPVQSRFSSEVA